MATLTYVYADQTVVLGPLSAQAEPHAYDLCERHVSRLSAPQGWDVVRLAHHFADPEPSGDDLLALADAVREAGRSQAARVEAGPATDLLVPGVRETARRGHLRMLDFDER